MWRLFWAPLVLGVVLLLPSPGEAFCRSTTAPRAAGVCPEPCITDGIPLAWKFPYATYTLNERGFPDLDEATTRAVLRRSFNAWNRVQCPEGDGDERPVGLDITDDLQTTSLEVGPDRDEPNNNVVVYFDAQRWQDEGLGDQAYALTAVWYDRNDGEILGADMHFNGGMGRLTVCPEDGCPPGDVDLGNVTTHEAGHFVGLAHSSEPGATMLCSAAREETLKRSLEADDEAGVCEAYPPGAFRTGPRTARGSCSVVWAGHGATWASCVVLALALAVLLQRRAR